MSFKVISESHGQRDSDLPPRAHDLSLRLSLLKGTFYDCLNLEFHEAFTNGAYNFALTRRPNVPTGTNEIRIQTDRHASFLAGETQFPEIETADERTRTILKRLIIETELANRVREASVIGSVGSVAIHMRALAKSGPLRVFFDVHETAFLTPTFDPYAPDTLIGMEEKRKVIGRDLKALGYAIKEEDEKSKFWFKRTWDQNAEVWFIPWLVDAEKKALEEGKPFTPVVDGTRSPKAHNLGFCPWVWIKNAHSGRGIDGACTFEAAIEHAIQLDYEDSMIVAGVRYNMSPTMVFQGPAPTNPVAPSGGLADPSAMAKTEQTVLKPGPDTKVYFVEMDGAGFEQARAKAKELRSSIIEAMHGDRVDPKEITQAHQGAQSMAMINGPMLKHVEALRSIYRSAILKLLKMALAVMEKVPVAVQGETITDLKPVSDLTVRWGDFYIPTAQEKLTLAQAHDSLIKAGIASRENATKDVASTFGIADVAEERARVEADRQADDSRAAALAGAVKVSATEQLP